MSAETVKEKDNLARDGQSQKQRYSEALDPLFAKVDSRVLKDLLQFSNDYSKLLNYFNELNIVEGDWSPFFTESPETVLARMENYGANESHLALYLSFLLLFKHAQDSINTITGRHLDFYYKKILQLKNEAAVPDKVHVFFELKKNISDQLIEAGTLLKAGKDNSGKELFYVTTQNIVVNTSAVSGLRSLFLDKNDKNKTYIAPVANSSDGIGGALSPEDAKWKPFGSTALPRAELGFALASPVLALREGTRSITVTLTLSGAAFPSNIASITKDWFLVYLTGEKGWIGPMTVSPQIKALSGGQYSMELRIAITKNDPAVVAFANDIHGGNFETLFPLIQFKLNNSVNPYPYHYLHGANLVSGRIGVDVKGISSLNLENDFGVLDPKKPFTPFGPSGLPGANFYIGSEEAFTKKLSKFSLDIEWKNVPEQSFGEQYKNYRSTDDNYIIVNNTSFKAQLQMQDGNSAEEKETVNLFDSSNAQSRHTISFPSTGEFQSNVQLVNVSYPPYSGYYLQKSSWASYKWTQMNSASSWLANVFQSPDTLQNVASEELKKGFIRLTLLTSFLHKEYRSTYTSNLVRYTKGEYKTLALPNEPYVPTIQSLTLNYSASTDEVSFASTEENDYLLSEIECYHLAAFGQMREHVFPKTLLAFVEDKKAYLLPRYDNEGEFYLGISDINTLQNVFILFQVAEGSAHPDKERQEVSWSILSDNYWMPLNSTYILSDTTNGLLTSGIIQFYIPQEATDLNTLFPSGTLWLRAAVSEDTDAVCQLLDVKTNAVLAEFQDQDNDPAHLAQALAANAITKLSVQPAPVKSVSQPYASFGGKMTETDMAFYTRVSERLRHKNRAINIWDYERIVLQNFSSVYKVKCIPHASDNSFYAPGHVSIIVIPDLKNKNAVNPLQPKVDLNTQSLIQDHLAKYNSGFVQLHVHNPTYEEIKLDFKVRFYPGYEFAYYKGVLNAAIKKFLSPWAYEDGEDIHFGGKIHKSVILNFIEECEYVDYVTDFNMYQIIDKKNNTVDVGMAETSNAKAILVSAAEHTIEPV